MTFAHFVISSETQLCKHYRGSSCLWKQLSTLFAKILDRDSKFYCIWKLKKFKYSASTLYSTRVLSGSFLGIWMKLWFYYYLNGEFRKGLISNFLGFFLSFLLHNSTSKENSTDAESEKLASGIFQTKKKFYNRTVFAVWSTEYGSFSNKHKFWLF